VIYYKGNLIIIVGLFSILYLLALASNNIITIWVVSGIVVIVGVIQNFALMGILLAACPDKRRAMWYQFYAFVYALAALIWSSLGPILADIIGIQLVFYLIIIIYLPLLYIMPTIDKEFKNIIELQKV
jgi:MFS family permease